MLFSIIGFIYIFKMCLIITFWRQSPIAMYRIHSYSLCVPNQCVNRCECRSHPLISWFHWNFDVIESKLVWCKNDEFIATKSTNRSMECRLKFSPQTINNALDLLDAAHKMQFINNKSNGKLLSINPWLNCKILLFAPAGEKHFKQKNSLSF